MALFMPKKMKSRREKAESISTERFVGQVNCLVTAPKVLVQQGGSGMKLLLVFKGIKPVSCVLYGWSAKHHRFHTMALKSNNIQSYNN